MKQEVGVIVPGGEGGTTGNGINGDQMVPVAGTSSSSTSAGSSSSSPSPPEDGFHWSKCVMGCGIPQGEEERERGEKLVMMLPCMHVLCSEGCITKLLANVAEPESPLCCPKCRQLVTREKLSNWVNLEREFCGKGGKPAKRMEEELICKICVFDKVAVAYCPECPATLCASCKEFHPMARTTQKHVITTDLSALRKATDPNACQKHPEQQLTQACLPCMEKLCGGCVEDHDKAHEIILIQAEKDKLLEKLRVARQFKGKCDEAVTEIRNKCTDLLPREFQKIMLEVNAQIEEVMRALRKRQLEIKNEVRKQFLAKKIGLVFTRKYTEMASSSTEQFIKTGESLLTSANDIGIINYLRRAENFNQWLSGMETKVVQNFDSFIEKDRHFVLSSSQEIQDQIMREFGQLSYKHQPSEPGRVIITLGSAETASRSSNGANAEHVLPTAPMEINGGNENGGSGQQQQSPSGSEVETDNGNPNDMAGSGSSQAPTTSIDNGELAEDRSSVEEIQMKEDEERVNVEETANDELPPTSFADDNSRPSTSTTSGGASTNSLGTLGSSAPSPGPALRTGSAELGKRERKQKVYSDFVGWSDVQVSELGVNPEPGPSTSTSSTGRGMFSNFLSGCPATGTRTGDQLQPLQPTASENGHSGNKRRGRPKRKHFAMEMVTDVDEDPEWEWEVGSGYVSEPDLGGGSLVMKRRSMRVMRKSQGQPRDPEMPMVEPVVISAVESQPPAPGSSTEPRQSSSALGSNHSSADIGDDQLQKINAFPEAPRSSVEAYRSSTIIPFLSPSLTRTKPKSQCKNAKTGGKQSDDYCFICRDDGDMICCDSCPKVFHLGCHIPVLESKPKEGNWKCNYCTTKRTIEEEISKYPEPDPGEDSALTKANKLNFPIACKFLMECYKIKELPTMRWRFPKGYLKKYGKVPYTLKYIKDRLCVGEPEPFGSVEEMMQAFKQMFTQGFMYLEAFEPKYVPYARTYFSKVLKLVHDYYPAHDGLLDEVKNSNDQ